MNGRTAKLLSRLTQDRRNKRRLKKVWTLMTSAERTKARRQMRIIIAKRDAKEDVRREILALAPGLVGLANG